MRPWHRLFQERVFQGPKGVPAIAALETEAIEQLSTLQLSVTIIIIFLLFLASIIFYFT